MFSALHRLIELDEAESGKQRERAAFLALMDAVIEALPDALVVVDLAGDIILFNQMAEFLFGYNRSEVVGRPMEMLMPERARERHIHDRTLYSRFEVNQRAQTMGIGMDLLAMRRDGHEFKVDITLSRVMSTNGVLTLALVRCSPREQGWVAAANGAPEPEQEIQDFNA